MVGHDNMVKPLQGMFKMNDLAHIISLILQDQANLICFWHMSSKLIKKKYLDYILSIVCVLLLFLVFPGKLSLCGQVNNFAPYPIFDPLDQANWICF